MRDVVVVGAGVSGLACARRLQREGLDVLVIEADTRPGGVVSSERVDGYLLESGPNTILPTPESMAAIAEAGIADEMVTAPPKAPRFVYAGGRLRRVPWVMSPAGTLRALAEPFVRRRGSETDESLASFFDRRFGRQAHERLAAPFVTGIYAGNTAELSIRGVFPRLPELEARYGSVMMGMLRGRGKGHRHRLASFKGGMGTLPAGLAAGLNVRYGAAARAIGRGWEVDVDGESLRTPAVVIATPAYAASQLLGSVDPDAAGLLESVCYAPIVVASFAVANSAMTSPLDGFGFLAPRGEGLNVLGTLFNSCLFAGRAPSGQSLLTSFAGGRLAPEVADWTDDRVWAAVCSDVEKVLSLGAGVAKPIRLKRYRRAIPQYLLGHREWRARIESRVRDLPGLFLTGNYIDGVSVPASMEHGVRTADAAIQYIRRTE